MVKVWQVNGTELWLLIHVEIQAQQETAFAQRMFTYNLRIFDQYQQVPISLAILCDESDRWRPEHYGAKYPDTELSFRFGTTKLIDYRTRWDELESSQNPFAIVVMAHLKVLETKRNVDQRKAWKFTLTRALYEKGYGRQEILDLYRFIDWVMILPEAAEREFWQELQTFEEGQKMTYVTNVERFGFERGIEQGMEQGAINAARSLILRQLVRRMGEISAMAEAKVLTLSVPQLEMLGEALLDFEFPADLDQWLQLS